MVENSFLIIIFYIKFQMTNGIARSLIKLEKRLSSHMMSMENVFETSSKLNKESKMHLEECLTVESSNDDIIVEAEQRLHSIQEEAKRLNVKKEEIAKVLFPARTQIIFNLYP